jgi:hypothetical protein
MFLRKKVYFLIIIAVVGTLLLITGSAVFHAGKKMALRRSILQLKVIDSAIQSLFSSEPQFFELIFSDGRVSEEEVYNLGKYLVDKKHISTELIDLSGSVIFLENGCELRIHPIMNANMITQVKVEGVLRVGNADQVPIDSKNVSEP